METWRRGYCWWWNVSPLPFCSSVPAIASTSPPLYVLFSISILSSVLSPYVLPFEVFSLISTRNFPSFFSLPHRSLSCVPEPLFDLLFPSRNLIDQSPSIHNTNSPKTNLILTNTYLQPTVPVLPSSSLFSNGTSHAQSTNKPPHSPKSVRASPSPPTPSVPC